MKKSKVQTLNLAKKTVRVLAHSGLQPAARGDSNKCGKSPTADCHPTVTCLTC